MAMSQYVIVTESTADLTQELVESQNLTTLMVTHNMNDAISIGTDLL